MYFKRFSYILIFLSFVLSLESVSYEDAYAMEKEDPLFSIPLYEELLRTSQKSDIRKTASSRLFFLYEKYRKYIPAILIMSRSGKITDKKGKYPSLVTELASGLNVSPSSLVSVISGCSRPIPDPDPFFQEQNSKENSSENLLEESADTSTVSPLPELPLLFKILSKKENAPLYKACYAVKIKMGDYDGWEKIHAFGEVRNILSPETSLALRISYTLHSDRGSAYKRIYSGGRLRSLSEEGKSDLLYLYGKFLRNLGKYDSSARYFWMSSSYGSKERGRIETAKTLLASGRKQEACGQIAKGFSPGDESEELLNRICFKNMDEGHPGQELLKAIRILNSDAPDPVYEFLLGRSSSQKTEDTEPEDSSENSSRYAKLLDEKLFGGEKNQTPFWDYRKAETTLVLSSNPAFLCKQGRSSLFKKTLIQPQNCVPFQGLSPEAILGSALFSQDQEEWSLLFANAAYHSVPARIVFRNETNEESLQITSVVYRKTLNRFFVEGYSSDGKYRFYSIDWKNLQTDTVEGN
ncbi:hypothetical protein [Leptospira stimsonii]|uniref:Tetratricopeptide repeat protein n=1 Tax=Leptospira stimsonii TaxID=2202203 RepID=A0ABY2N5E4_9LEPT|nr:hypothetical protein [Leptospira stimsonii]TGK26928.1 hypothetical protein EHO98_00195 [Leptospira stimsonii]TGM17327.1 hypothetical protein EHQ90_07435 [Leptospira stimsonii]